MTDLRNPLVPGQPPFFVIIIESPNLADIGAGRQEGPSLVAILRLIRIPVFFRTVTSKDSLPAALSELNDEAVALHQDHNAMLHISAHGGKEYLQFTDGSAVTFGELAALVKPIHAYHHSHLVLCLSACAAAEYVGTILVNPPEFDTFFAMVSTWGSPTWPETAIGFATFYHLMRKGYDLPAAVEAMGIASGHAGFTCARADRTRARYENLFRQGGST